MKTWYLRDIRDTQLCLPKIHFHFRLHNKETKCYDKGKGCQKCSNLKLDLLLEDSLNMIKYGCWPAQDVLVWLLNKPSSRTDNTIRVVINTMCYKLMSLIRIWLSVDLACWGTWPSAQNQGQEPISCLSSCLLLPSTLRSPLHWQKLLLKNEPRSHNLTRPIPAHAHIFFYHTTGLSWFGLLPNWKLGLFFVDHTKYCIHW